MVYYLLLRNNVETGPFSLQELASKSLKPTDLIWIEGRSVAWKYPAEIETLQPLLSKERFAPEPEWGNDGLTNAPAGIFVAMPVQAPQVEAEEKAHSASYYDINNTTVERPFENVTEKNTAGAKPYRFFQQHKTFSKAHNALWLGCVFAGLFLSATIVKKMVEAYDERVTGIKTVAALPAPDADYFNRTQEENPYQNALTTEVVPIDTTTRQEVKKTPVKINFKKLVSLDVNDYQVGLLGGIKNLRMLVTNKSGYLLNEINIELNYLKPNGGVIKTENLVMKAVAPKSSKSLAVAAQKRGVKISYRITGIQPKSDMANMVRL